MDRWKPVRKIAAAMAAALLGTGGALTLYLAGEIDARAALALAVTALGPVLVGYLTHTEPRELRGGTPMDPDPHEM